MSSTMADACPDLHRLGYVPDIFEGLSHCETGCVAVQLRARGTMESGAADFGADVSRTLEMIG